MHAEAAQAVTYAVAVRPEAARLVQTEKLVLMITVGRKSHTIERITAGLRDPMRVALGLAKVTNVDFDLAFDFAPPSGNASSPSAETRAANSEQPSGTARVALSKLGQQMEFEWSDFKRVDAYRVAPR